MRGSAAPQNAHVLLEFPARWWTRYLPEKTEGPEYRIEEVLLRRVGSAEPIQAQRSIDAQKFDTRIELRPNQLLAPGEYEVAATAGGVERVLGEFTVGQGIDRTAPRWSRPPRAYFPPQPAVFRLRRLWDEVP